MSMLNVYVPVHVHAAHHRCVCVCEGVFMCVFVCINARMADCLTSDQVKKLTMPGQVWYPTKPRQSGIFLVWYWTEIIDARMPMPALVSWMPMPSYAIPLQLLVTDNFNVTKLLLVTTKSN